MKLTRDLSLRAANLRIVMRQHEADGVITLEERRVEHKMSGFVVAVAELLDLEEAEHEYAKKAGPFAPPYPALVRQKREVRRLLEELAPEYLYGTSHDYDYEDDVSGCAPSTVRLPLHLERRHGLVLVKSKKRTRQVAPGQVHSMSSTANVRNSR